jgi:signal transduction histidine kinase
LWLVGGLRRSSVPVLFTAGGVLTNLYLVVAAWIVLGFPEGRLRKPEERWCVAGAGVLATIGVACEWLFFDPRAVAARYSSVSSSINLLLIGDHPVLDDVVELGIGSLIVVLVGVFLALLVQRWRSESESHTYRVSFVPVVGTALVSVVAAVWIVLTTGLLGPVLGRTPSWGFWVGLIVMAAVVVAGLEVGRRRFGAPLAGSVAIAMSGCFVLAGVVYFVFPEMRLPAVRYLVPSGVVVAIGGGHLYYCYLQQRQIQLLYELTTAGLNVAMRGLRGVVGDPAIELWRWDATVAGYVGADGRTRTADRAAGPVVCELTRNDVRLGALVCSASVLRAQPELLDGAKAIAASLLERERSLIELGESRRRIVAAGDEQRRRIERDLHDGAQNRIIHVMYLIQFARRAIEDEQRNALLGEAADHLTQALNELRDLTHGVYPPELVQSGLRAALTSLAERSSMPTTIVGAEAPRLPVEVEAAGYFIAAEAVANANKHAGATGVEIRVDCARDTLRIDVSDNGRGGAVPTGKGLRGLRDRAEALGGRFTLDSPAGGGTVVAVTLPIDDGRSR